MADGASSRVLELARREDNPTRDEVTEAVELLGLKEHERPEGYYVPWNDTLHVRIHKPVPLTLTVAEARALCVLLLDQCAQAEQQLEDEQRAERFDSFPVVMP